MTSEIAIALPSPISTILENEKHDSSSDALTSRDTIPDATSASDTTASCTASASSVTNEEETRELIENSSSNPEGNIVECAAVGGAEAALSYEEQHEHQALILSQLARQLEYYLSQQNLSKDTYVQTLRNLNDGCVPATILANFAKVKAILLPYYAYVTPSGADKKSAIMSEDEEVRLHCVLQAAAEYSDQLQVYSIDTATGKLTTDDTPSSAKTILAIGTLDRQPLPLPPTRLKVSASTASFPTVVSSWLPSYDTAPFVTSARQTVPPSPRQTVPPSPSSTSTVVLRDVSPGVTEEQVRDAFDFEGCPEILTVHLDLYNYWFVTLDPSCTREDMIYVLQQLRSRTLADEPIFARMKAPSAASVGADTAPPMPLSSVSTSTSVPDMTDFFGAFVPVPESGGFSGSNHGNNGSKKKKKNKKANAKKGNQNQNNASNGNKGSDSKGKKNNSGSQQGSNCTNSINCSGGNNKNNHDSGRGNALGSNNAVSEQEKRVSKPKLPSFCEDDFPSLQAEKKVEWGIVDSSDAKVEIVKEIDAGMDHKQQVVASMSMASLDAASTTTTASSSTDSTSNKKTGYAAAVLKPASAVKSSRSSNATPIQVEETRISVSDETTSKIDEQKTQVVEPASEKVASSTSKNAEAASPLKVTAPGWGRGRSFAEIVRN